MTNTKYLTYDAATEAICKNWSNEAQNAEKCVNAPTGLHGVRGPAAAAPAQGPGPGAALPPLPLGGARPLPGRHGGGTHPRGEGRACKAEEAPEVQEVGLALGDRLVLPRHGALQVARG